MEAALHQGQRRACAAEFRAEDSGFLLGGNIRDLTHIQVESQTGGDGEKFALGPHQFWLDQSGFGRLDSPGKGYLAARPANRDGNWRPPLAIMDQQCKKIG
jgi:hypothetical protein